MTNYKLLIKLGMDYISEGKFQEADQAFFEILESNPDEPDALYGRALVFYMAKRFDLSIGFAGRAVQLSSKPEYYVILGKALHCQGHLNEAKSALKSAIILQPSDDRALNAIARVYNDLDDYTRAEQTFKQAVELQQKTFNYWNDLIDFYWDRHFYETALSVAQESVRNNPGEIDFLFKLALVLQALNLLDEAVIVYKKIIHLKHDDYGAYANLGGILFQLNQIDEAKHYLEKAFDKQNDNSECQVNLSLVYMAEGSLLKSLKLLKKVYDKFPADLKIGLNLGTLFFELGMIDEAEKLYIRLFHDDDLHFLSEEDQNRIKYNLSSVLLAKCQFKEGWRLMESRHPLLEIAPEYSDIPFWDGKVLKGTLLIRSEQGLGDILQFIRYLPYLDKNLSIILEVPLPVYRLVGLVIVQQELNNICKVIVKGEEINQPIDFQARLMSLPYLLDINFIPIMPTVILDKTNEIVLHENKFHVGICWAGSPDYRFDRIRSISFKLLSTLFSIQHVIFQSLQINFSQKLLDKYKILTLPQGDLLDTAIIMQKMDLIITVDTVIAHLAGILGKETWLLNRYGGDWRWYNQSPDIPKKNLWYPTLTLFKQEKAGNGEESWQAVIDKVKLALEKKVSKFIN